MTKLEYVTAMSRIFPELNDDDHMRFIRIMDVLDKNNKVMYPEILNIIFYGNANKMSDHFTKICEFLLEKLNNECELVAVNLSKVEDKLETTLKNLGSLKEDEARAREQLYEIKNIINNSKYKIKDYDLPVIPERFYIELKAAYDAIGEINKEIEKKPISIKTLNLRVDTAQDLSLKLYQTASSTTKTAAMAEMAIVYGNRYRSSNKEVEKGLIASEKAFYKGNYKESLEIILNALNIVEPGIHKKLLNKMES